jgi:hypothetical protein
MFLVLIINNNIFNLVVLIVSTVDNVEKVSFVEVKLLKLIVESKRLKGEWSVFKISFLHTL